MWERRNVRIGAFVLLGLIALALVAAAQVNSANKLADSRSMASQTVSAMSFARATVDADLAQSESGRATSLAEQARLATQVGALTAQNATAVAAQASSATQVADLTTQLRATGQRASAFEAYGDCKVAPDSIDYTSNSTVSASLKRWLQTTEGKITNENWDVVWDNSQTAIHDLTGRHLFAFIVYYDEPALGNQQSVFDVTNQCWLDR